MATILRSSRVGPAPAASELIQRSPPRKDKRSDEDPAPRRMIGAFFRQQAAQASSPLQGMHQFAVAAKAEVVDLKDRVERGLEAHGASFMDEALGDVIGNDGLNLPGAIQDFASVMITNPVVEGQGDSGAHSGGDPSGDGIQGNEAPEKPIEIEIGNAATAARSLVQGNPVAAVETMTDQSISGLVVEVATRVLSLVGNHCPHLAMPACVTNCIEQHPVAWARTKQLSKWAAACVATTVVGKLAIS